MIEIGTTIDDIERIYRGRSQSTGYSVDYPSFDEPYYHPGLQTRISLNPSRATRTLLPRRCASGQFSSAIYFLEAANIVKSLREAGPAGPLVREIHRLVLDLRTNSKTAAPPDMVPLTLDTWVGFAPGRAGRLRVLLDAGLTYVS